MKKSILASAAVAAVSSVILGCSQTTQTSLFSDAQTLTAAAEQPSIRAEDQLLLDEFAAKTQVDNELWFMSGGDMSSVSATLRNIDQARDRLAQMEFEKARMMELGEELAKSGQIDLESFYVSLKAIENQREAVLASIGVALQ